MSRHDHQLWCQKEHLQLDFTEEILINHEQIMSEVTVFLIQNKTASQGLKPAALHREKNM